MKTTMLFAMLFVVGSFSVGKAVADEEYGVNTIYNRAGVQFTYQLREKKIGSDKWGKWTEHKAEVKKGIMHWHVDPNHWDIQIRFDMIAGDGKYTEKLYSLEVFKRPFKNTRAGGFKPSDGWIYIFYFKEGTNILLLRMKPGRRAPK